MADQRRRVAESSGPTAGFGRLDLVLSGEGASRDPEGLNYEDPQALFRAEMERVRREGLVH